MADTEWHRRSSYEKTKAQREEGDSEEAVLEAEEISDIPDMPPEEERPAMPRRSGIRVAEGSGRGAIRDVPLRSSSRERNRKGKGNTRGGDEQDKKDSASTSSTKPSTRYKSSRRRKQQNYRMMLCAAVLGASLMAVLFLGLFVWQHGKAKGLKEQVDNLTMEKTTLTNQLSALSQEAETLRKSLMDSLPEPKTAQTDSLPELIPQLTDALYVIHVGDGFDYIKVPEGYFTDTLNTYKDAQGYASTGGSSPTCPYLVLYPDRVIGLADGDVGYVSNERTSVGTASSLPVGFTAFVASFFA